MAYCITTQWKAYAPQVKLTVTESSSTATTSTLSWTLQYIAESPANSNGARAYTVTIGGSTVKTGTYDIDGKTGTYTIASGTTDINKTTAAQNVSFSVSFTFNLTWTGVYGGTKSASGSIAVAKKTSYSVKYNANGGSGAPSTQTKWHGTALTLSSTEPTRNGYTFGGWATSASGSKSYGKGDSYTANASVTLYAVWTAITYTVTYNANGGTGKPANQTKTYGVTLTLSSTKPTRTNYAFQGWGTSASTTTVSYKAGGAYTKNANITLYAVWKLSYVKPRITNLSVGRCTSDKTASEEGKYARVKFNWACDSTVSTVKIEWKLSSASSWGNSTTVTSSGTSGSVDIAIGADALSTDNSYHIRVTVTDADGSSNKQVTLGGMTFPIDIYRTGKGIAFGKPAEIANCMDIGYKTRCRNNIVFDNNTGGIYGTTKPVTIDEQLIEQTDIHLMNLNENNNLVIGYGGYNINLGATNIYGKTINLTSDKSSNADTSIFIEGRKLSSNNVLWTGGSYMGSSQTCDLSEAVTAQANGVILIWSEYNATNSAYENANFNITFVPRRFVHAHLGKGISCHCASATGNIQAIKYVYINDTTITGYEKNNADPYEATCGITMSPKKFVLRYVIGV